MDGWIGLDWILLRGLVQLEHLAVLIREVIGGTTTRIGPLTKPERILSRIGRKEESLYVALYMITSRSNKKSTGLIRTGRLVYICFGKITKLYSILQVYRLEGSDDKCLFQKITRILSSVGSSGPH